MRVSNWADALQRLGFTQGVRMNAISISAVSPLYPAGALNPQADGSVTVVANSSTGQVFSCSSGGVLSEKPAGTVDDTTKATISGNFIVFAPGGSRYAFLWLTNSL